MVVVKLSCQVPVKVVIMNRNCNTGVRCDSIRSGVTVSITPRSRRYGDVTVTYIWRSEIPSRIYAKHQYRKESECESIVVIYIPTKKYKYMDITESDTILHEYYITRKYKSTLYEEIYIIKDERC